MGCAMNDVMARKGIYRVNGCAGMVNEDGCSEMVKISKCSHNHRTVEASNKCVMRRIMVAKGISLTLCNEED